MEFEENEPYRDGKTSAYGTTWKIYWASPDEILTPEDICEMLGAVKAEKHYQASEPARVTPTIDQGE